MTPFELNNYKYCIKYANGFLVMYDMFLPQTTECKNNSYVHPNKTYLN